MIFSIHTNLQDLPVLLFILSNTVRITNNCTLLKATSSHSTSYGF